MIAFIFAIIDYLISLFWLLLRHFIISLFIIDIISIFHYYWFFSPRLLLPLFHYAIAIIIFISLLPLRHYFHDTAYATIIHIDMIHSCHYWLAMTLYLADIIIDRLLILLTLLLILILIIVHWYWYWYFHYFITLSWHWYWLRHYWYWYYYYDADITLLLPLIIDTPHCQLTLFHYWCRH
jgi:hypothetical protein